MSRDVLAPPLQRIGNRNYRVNLISDDFGGNKLTDQEQDTSTGKNNVGYTEQDLYADDDSEEGDDEPCAIEELANGMFQLKLHVANSLYGGIIGFKGTTKRRIETESQAEIYVPRSNDKSNNLIIKGKTRSNVCAAQRKIRLVIDSLRNKMRPTHFGAVALNKKEIQEKFLEFKQTILQAEFPGIDELLFSSERCLHLTLFLCVLLDEAERNHAIEVLQSCREFLDGLDTPFDVQVKGLEIMNDDPGSTRVLYARVNAPVLQIFADKCVKAFADSGLAATDKYIRDSVKLHMTVMNVRNRREATDFRSEISFDAREILKRFGDFDFGTTQCNEIHLCVMKSSKEVENFYHITSTLNF